MRHTMRYTCIVNDENRIRCRRMMRGTPLAAGISRRRACLVDCLVRYPPPHGFAARIALLHNYNRLRASRRKEYRKHIDRHAA